MPRYEYEIIETDQIRGFVADAKIDLGNNIVVDREEEEGKSGGRDWRGRDRAGSRAFANALVFENDVALKER
jgi:hypothetical protein